MIEINESLSLTVNPSDYIRGNKNPSTITLYTSGKNNCSLHDIERFDKANNKLTFSGHFYIRSNGEIYKGRPLDCIGEFAYNSSKTQDLNYDNIGICIEGDFNTDFLQDIQKFAIFRLFEYLKGELNNEAIRMLYLRELDLNNDPGVLFPFGDISRFYYDLFPVTRGLIGNLQYDSFGSRELYFNPVNIMKGTDVYTIHILLKKLGFYEGLMDGVFDENTKIAVNNYQVARDLVGTGIAGFKTLDKMTEDIKKIYASKCFNRVLEKEQGNEELQGTDILSLQKQLNIKKYTCKETGVYDKETVDAVEKFQASNGIDIDGKVGPITWDMIFKDESNSNFRILMLVSNNVMYGDDVKMLQERLTELGYRMPITEKYDFLTEGQVRRYQIQKNFVNKNGIVTLDVWEKIFSSDQSPLP